MFRFFVAVLFFFLSFPLFQTEARHRGDRCRIHSYSVVPTDCIRGNDHLRVECGDSTSTNVGNFGGCIPRRDLLFQARRYCESRCEPCPESPSVDGLIALICAKVNECRPAIEVEDCITAMDEVTGVPEEFGVIDGLLEERTTFSEVRAAFSEGTIHIAGEVYCDCTRRIRALTCSAFRRYVNSTSELWRLEEVLPDQCGQDDYSDLFVP